MHDQIYNNLTDRELVEAIVNDDQTAFKELYYRYFKILVRFSWYRLHCSETSSDLVQDLFYKIWSQRQRLDPSKSIKAYLYKALNNMIINHSALSHSHTYSLESITDENNSFNQNDIDLMIDIGKAVDDLPEKLRVVYMLSRIEGYKYSEIAAICEISVKAVEKRMSQAFERLRKKINN